MVKAIIALIYKWAYRCEHDWVLMNHVQVDSDWGGVDHHKFIFRCTKCCEFRTHETR